MESDTVPRLLTKQEIEDIVDMIPPVRGAIKSVTENARSAMRSRYRDLLSTIKLAPAALEDFKTEFRNGFLRAQVAPGEAVGIRASEAIAAQVTQLTLKSFHTSGSAVSMSSGISGIQALFYASKSTQRTTIMHFKEKGLSYEDVFSKAAKYIEVFVGQLVEDDQPDIESINNFELEWWHKLYGEIYQKKIPTDSNWYLRLKLKTYLMYYHKITPEMVVNALEIAGAGSIVCFASPIHIGIIDVFPREEQIQATSMGTMRELMTSIPMNILGLNFLSQAVRLKLGDIYVKGVHGLKALFPISSPVLQIVRKEALAFELDQIAKQKSKEVAAAMSRAWSLSLNIKRIQETGISREDLSHLCKLVGIKVNQVETKFIVVLMPDKKELDPIFQGLYEKYRNMDGKRQIAEKYREYLNRNVISPMEYINIRIDEDSREAKEWEADHPGEGRRPPSALELAKGSYYAEVIGSNLRDLLKDTELDRPHLYSDDFHEVAEVLGIEAARTILLRTFFNAMTAAGSKMNSRHPELIISFMTNRGEITATNSYGISRQSVGPFAAASVDRALQRFTTAAQTGKYESVASTSTAVFVARRPEIGTGMVKISVNEEELANYRKAALERAAARKKSREAVPASSFATALTEMTQAAPMLQNIDEKDALADMFAVEDKPIIPTQPIEPPVSNTLVIPEAAKESVIKVNPLPPPPALTALAIKLPTVTKVAIKEAPQTITTVASEAPPQPKKPISIILPSLRKQ